MIRLFLLPGDLVCNACEVPRESDHRQILRGFVNTIVWGAIAVASALKLAV